jgi:hypothetical protein
MALALSLAQMLAQAVRAASHLRDTQLAGRHLAALAAAAAAAAAVEQFATRHDQAGARDAGDECCGTSQPPALEGGL